MTKLAILHYLPLEYYPPITNLIDYIAYSRSNDLKKVRVYSCRNVKRRVNFEVDNKIKDENNREFWKEIILHRSSFPKEKDNWIIRFLKYAHFNLSTLINLIYFHPHVLLYYESYSAWPVYIYTKFINRKCKLFIHQHEYASKEWYYNTMKLVIFFHYIEKKWLYPNAIWISQTNSNRLDFFHDDHPNLKMEQLKVMPNYPPIKWKNEEGYVRKEYTTNKEQIKLIYVGSLSFESTYLKEICEWVVSQNGRILFDVYAYNLYNDVKEYLKSLKSSYVNYYENGIEYHHQPQILSQYDVGLILYKPHNLNYTYNAPNKLFEYLACDIDVWYPEVLQGPKPYITQEFYPKVIPVNFDDLVHFNYKKAICKEGLKYKESEFFCEEIYKGLMDEIVKI